MNRLREVREAQGIRKSEMARRLSIHRSEYGRIEERIDQGIRGTTPELADQIAKEFGNAVTRDQILFPKDYMEQKAS